jgi:hypothetical protein
MIMYKQHFHVSGLWYGLGLLFLTNAAAFNNISAIITLLPFFIEMLHNDWI